MRVLVVEDDETSAEILEAYVRNYGYHVTVARDGIQALQLLRTGLYRLVVSDWEMPEMSGVDLCRHIRSRQAGGYTYFILLTSRGGTRNVVEGLSAGADDFITKPFQPEELQVRLRSAERVLSLESRDLLIFSLAKLAESRDKETGAHLERIRIYSRILAEHVSQVEKYREIADGEFVQLVFQTSPLHDIGKVGVPDSVLCKPSDLTPAEFEVMKTHTTIGAQTLDAALQIRPETAYLRMARDIAWTHHEKHDGSGYPRGLAGNEIPLCGRIVALADVYDALTTRRVYKPAFSHDHTRRIIVEGSGTHFDPDMVDAFVAQEDFFQEVTRQIAFQQAHMTTDEDRAALAVTSIASD